MTTNEKKIPEIRFGKLLKYALGLIYNPLKAISGIVHDYGDIATLKIAKIGRIIFVNHPDFVKHILKDNQENYSRRKAISQPSFSALKELLGNGIFTSDGEDWEKQHRLLQNLFSPTSNSATLPIIESELKKMQADWENKLLSSPIIDIEQDMHLLILRILLRTHVSDTISVDPEKIFASLRGFTNSSNSKVIFSIQLKALFLKTFNIKYHYKKSQKYLDYLFSVTDTLVAGLIENQYKPTGLFAMMLEDYRLKRVTEQDIKDQFLNFLFAGFETTATGIVFTLFNLATHPEIQQSLVNELMQENTETGSFSNSKLDKVIRESLRLYPPVWSYARETIKEDNINGYNIPANTLILISAYALHRHKDFWENPEIFNINNFEKELFVGKSFAYIPFGQGKRMCIGKALADFQMKNILIPLLKTYSFDAIGQPGIKINPNIIMKTVNPIKLNVYFNK